MKLNLVADYVVSGTGGKRGGEMTADEILLAANRKWLAACGVTDWRTMRRAVKAAQKKTIRQFIKFVAAFNEWEMLWVFGSRRQGNRLECQTEKGTNADSEADCKDRELHRRELQMIIYLNEIETLELAPDNALGFAPGWYAIALIRAKCWGPFESVGALADWLLGRMCQEATK